VNFFLKLTRAIQQNNSLLCVGLDPVEKHLPEGPDIFSRLVTWGTDLVISTSDLVCCYKPNIAFYEQFGPKGLRAMIEILKTIPDSIPVILDAKRGDIGSSAAAYARGAYQHFRVDAITLSPYLGADSIGVFTEDADKAVFILCHTSNPSAKELQHFGDPPLYEHIARMANSWGTRDQVGLVIGATQPEALQSVRKISPDLWFLAPGVGAQGGDLQQALQTGLREDGLGMIIPVSRGVMTAKNPRQAAEAIQQAINTVREAYSPAPVPTQKEALILELFAYGCVRFGEFTLASGKKSPIYIDLRRVISSSDLFRKVVAAYVGKLRHLDYDLVAGVPTAALPASAVIAWKLEKALIYPRKDPKSHGTARAIEGVFQSGQRAVMIEDVITSGGSILAAAEALRAGGLVVEDAVVAVDRKQGGVETMAQHGIRIHPVLDIFEMIAVLKAHGCIDAVTQADVLEYLEQDGDA